MLASFILKILSFRTYEETCLATIKASVSRIFIHNIVICIAFFWPTLIIFINEISWFHFTQQGRSMTSVLILLQEWLLATLVVALRITSFALGPRGLLTVNNTYGFKAQRQEQWP